MDLNWHISLLIIFWILSVGHGQKYTLTTNFDGSIKLGKEAVFKCEVSSSYSASSIVWTRRQGSLVSEMAADSLLADAYQNTRRYTLSQAGLADGSAMHTLTIRNAQYEDTASIACSIRAQSEEIDFITLAVCDDTNSDWCKCVIEKGWNDPKCFDKPGSYKSLETNSRRTFIGLGVCLAILLIYSVIVTIIIAWDCMKRIKARRERDAKIKQFNRNYDPFADSEEVVIDPDESVTESQVGLAAYTDRPHNGRLPSASSSGPPIYNGSMATASPARPPATAPQSRSSAPPPRPTAPPRSTSTHVNRGFQDDEDDRELGATNYPEPRQTVQADVYGGPAYNPNYGGASAAPPAVISDNYDLPSRHDRDVPDGSSTGSYDRSQAPEYTDVPQEGYRGARPRTNQYETRMNLNDTSAYNDSSRYGDNVKSPSGWSTKSDSAYGQSRYPGQPGNDQYGGRNAYSERPPRDQQYGSRGGYAEPKRLDFANGKTAPQQYGDYNRQGSYGNQSNYGNQGNYGNQAQSGGAFVDMSDTVV